MIDPEFAKKIDSGTTMAEMWQGFSSAVIPNVDMTSVQFSEMRNAFYAGALCLFNWFMVQMDDTGDPDEITDADMSRVTAINDELHRYFLERIASALSGHTASGPDEAQQEG